MPREVIMPALGMAQDTGLLVAWRKAPGDAVAVGDILFEVETDKATMEVEATEAGFLSNVTAAAGQDVPVGQVIARIVAEAGEVAQKAPVAVADATAAAAHPPVTPAVVAVPRPPEAREGAAAPGGQAVTAAVPQGRILASPKARRVATERGIDLGRLAAAGVPQPIHVADLDRMPPVAASRSVLTARADGAALDALLGRAKATDAARLFAAFATGAWRMAGGTGALAVTLLRRDGLQDGADEAGVPLLLADLTATRLTGYVPQAEGLALSVARDGASVVLTLAFDEVAMPFPVALAWLDEVAARIEDPIRQLV